MGNSSIAKLDHFAQRVLKQAGPDPNAEVDLAFRLALGRSPKRTNNEKCWPYILEIPESGSASSNWVPCCST